MRSGQIAMHRMSASFWPGATSTPKDPVPAACWPVSVARLENLGTRVLERHGHQVVMQDPEGNEFCVEPGPAAGPS